jgi:succinyl-CoA synthetase beta subunit
VVLALIISKNMNIHEYQAKEILKTNNVAVPVGYSALTVSELVEKAKLLEKAGYGVFVVKAQIHAGGRGKAGGVKVVKTIAAVEEEATKMLGMTLVTPQTDANGRVVKRLYVEAGANIDKEYYVSLVLDRVTSSVVIIASAEGGMDIEEISAKHPEKIIQVSIDPIIGFEDFYGREVAYKLGLTGNDVKQFIAVLKGLYAAFVTNDTMQIEINPLIRTKEGAFVCLDGKFNFDDNALYRQPNIVALRDFDEEEPLEIEASKHGLSYIKMEGNIGCMVNGAGLAMATMDIIKLYGGQPANFLDVGGGANKEKVAAAFKIILSDKAVKAVLVNIFGGIMRCDIIAEGIIAAVKEVNLTVPLVVRLEGTNVDLGKKILAESGLNVISADDLGDAAQKAVASIN